MHRNQYFVTSQKDTELPSQLLAPPSEAASFKTRGSVEGGVLAGGKQRAKCAVFLHTEVVFFFH